MSTFHSKFSVSQLTLSVCYGATLGCLVPIQAQADVFYPPLLQPSQSDFGGVGLMQMPTGRSAPEGEFNIGGTFNEDYYHGSVSLQLMPWLETTIRYTQVQDMLYNSDSAYSGDNEYTDKGIDVKFRIFEEGYWLPETAIGMRDLGGTGLFDGEYIAATKRFGNLDFTLGLGWGYLGTRSNVTNPLCDIADSYCSRSNAYSNNGGSIDAERWFKGPTAIFGGVEYQTSHEPLRFKLEYDSNDYSGDYPVVNSDKEMTAHTPWNIGMLYALQDWGDVRVSYERGDTLTVGFSFHSNFNQSTSTWRDTPKANYQPRQYSDNPDWLKVVQDIDENAGYKQTILSEEGSNLTVTGEPTKYRDLNEAHERAALLLSQYRSDDIETYTFVEKSKNLELKRTTYNADEFDEIANNAYFEAKIEDAEVEQTEATTSPRQEKVLATTNDALSYGLSPTVSQSFGGPESFYLYAIGVTASSRYQLTDSLELSGSLYFNLVDNYDEFNYVEENPHISNFSVPRVRTLFRYYVHDHPVRMNRLQLTWFKQLSENMYFQSYAGYLETMFAGVGGEILYRPENSNWAIGADLNMISQRDPNNWFSVYNDDYFEYDSGCENGVYTYSCAAYVLSRGETGFLSAYYTPQWTLLRNTRFKVSVGQFLGQDKGARVDFSKQFDSGVITGAFASFSDLTSEEYGEGSFTKGFYISIPLDILTVKPSRNRGQFSWQPITRDGGQILNRQYELYQVTDARSPWFTRPKEQ